MNIRTISYLLTLLAIVFSCSTDIEDTNSVSINDKKTCTMHLNASVIPFDYSVDSRATTSYSWKNGDKLYINFNSATTYVRYGTATYNSTTRTWDVTYEGDLVRGLTVSCKVYYFEGKTSNGENDIKLTSEDPVYGDVDATYIFPTDGDLTITASIKPLTSRIRFKGTVGKELTIRGLAYYNIFNTNVGVILLKNNSSISTTIQSNGYTPYIYGVFESSIAPGISLAYNDQSFIADCKGLSILEIGKSGWMDVPTTTSHNGWSINTTGGTLGEHDYVDLGLPSGTLWATMNIGASSPEDYGDYFAWGETEGYNGGKKSFNWSSYKWGGQNTLTKYCTNVQGLSFGNIDNITELEKEDDAAHKCWGEGWRIPSIEQFRELWENSTTKWTMQNGVYGEMLTSKKNGKTIFFPATGTYIGTEMYNPNENGGKYWSSSLDTGYPSYAYIFQISDKVHYVGVSTTFRDYGCTIRPVSNSLFIN